MDQDILISVIVPVYNVEEYLPRCVDSLLSQSYEKLEIILVDDGNLRCLCRPGSPGKGDPQGKRWSQQRPERGH